MQSFNGVYAASATPMHPDFSCDYQELASHCQDLIARGCNGVILFGTTGEGPSFSVEERKKALQAVIPLGVDPHRCIVGIACSAIEDAVEIARCAVECHYSAVMIVPPFFFKQVDDAGVIAYYREVIRRARHPDLKVILYHIPQFSGVPITLSSIQLLREEFPEIVVALKESEGNLNLTREVLKRFPGFKVFVGNELQISEAVQAGAAGAISGLANIFPELICALYQHGRDPQMPNRNEEVSRILEAIKRYPLFPAIKSLIETKKGARWQAMRPPLYPLDEAQNATLTAFFAS